MLCVQVRNPGHLEQDTRDGGVGLQNLRERLRLLYGAEATLTLSMDEPGTVLAEARIPQHDPATPDAVPSSSEPTYGVAT
jgi:LytS/YehU family sensor histidine kinase